MNDLFPAEAERQGERKARRSSRTTNYRDETKMLLQSDDPPGRQVIFPQASPETRRFMVNGNSNGCRRVAVTGCPQLLAADPGPRRVFIVEGEKDADKPWQPLGLVGDDQRRRRRKMEGRVQAEQPEGPARPSFFPTMMIRGGRHAAGSRGQFSRARPASIRILETGRTGRDKGDVSDWLAAGWDERRKAGSRPGRGGRAGNGRFDCSGGTSPKPKAKKSRPKCTEGQGDPIVGYFNPRGKTDLANRAATGERNTVKTYDGATPGINGSCSTGSRWKQDGLRIR